MNKEKQRQVAGKLLSHWKQSYAREAGVKLEDKPAALFQLLVCSTLFSARIGAGQASEAMNALIADGLTTPRKMCDAGWEKRVKILNENGYARYDERTSRMLGDSSELLLDKYGGDLRRLREAAGHDPEKETSLLQEFKGIGKVGAAIFRREVQAIWDEAYPFVDERAQQGAIKAGLPKTAPSLANLTDNPRRMAHLASSLVRLDLLRESERKKILSAAI